MLKVGQPVLSEGRATSMVVTEWTLEEPLNLWLVQKAYCA